MGVPQTGSISFDVGARQAHVVGEVPRILPLRNDEMGNEARDLVSRVRASIGSAPIEDVPEYMRTMLKHPSIFRCQMEMGTAVFRGQIPPDERELAILRVGWLCRAPYEWGEHVGIAKRYGLSPEQIERVTRGSSAAGWSDHERAILLGVEELIGDQALSDATWDALSRTWNEAQMIEFTMMVGQYVATAFIQNSLRVRLAPDNPGLTRR